MQDSNTLSLLNKMKTGFLIVAAILTMQANAADEDGLPNQTIQQEKPASGEVSENQEEVIEEITVIGQKFILSLREQIIQAEDHAFEIFNELNDDDMYDVHCRMVARTGTLIRKRMCLPNFYHRATADNAQDFLGLIGGYTNISFPSPTAKNVLAYRFPIFKDKVKELAKKNPELLGAMQDLFNLTNELIKARNTYHGLDDK